ncbi:MAG: GNAT family N-acetyltransferase [Balneolales bacterium]|nr:GNAT family N-acetyltransferase [Balneolales bacterium]
MITKFNATYLDFELRLASQDDIPALTRIIEDVFIEYGWIFVAKDELPDFLDFDVYFESNTMQPGKPRLFKVERTTDGGKSRICGCIALKFNIEGAYLSRVYLQENVRGKGVGQWIVEEVMGISRVEGGTEMHLWTDTRFEAAHRLYEKLGFAKTNEIRSLHDINNSFEWKMVTKL